MEGVGRGEGHQHRGGRGGKEGVIVKRGMGEEKDETRMGGRETIMKRVKIIEERKIYLIFSMFSQGCSSIHILYLTFLFLFLLLVLLGAFFLIFPHMLGLPILAPS